MPYSFIVALLLLFKTTAVFAADCSADDWPDQISEPALQSFHQQLKTMDRPAFSGRYCALTPSERAFAIEIYQSAYAALSEDRQQDLVRMSIMVLDLEENLAWVAENGTIREEDDEWESIAIERFAKNVRLQFPETVKVLDDAYFAKINQLYRAAHDLIHSREMSADRKVTMAKQEILLLESKISDLKREIVGHKQNRRSQRVLRHELELYKPQNF